MSDEPVIMKYRVSDVWGSMIGRLDNGQTIIDFDQGAEHPYTIYNENSGEVTGGWLGKRISRVTDQRTIDSFLKRKN